MMRKRTTWILRAGLIVMFLFMACQASDRVATSLTPTPRAATAPTVPPTREPAVSPDPTATPPLPAADPTRPEPTAELGSPSQDAPAGVSFDYDPIPLGEEFETILEGRKISIKINKVTTGSQADSIALAEAPDEMQWVIVQLMIKYIEGEANTRAQLVDTGMFQIVSKGNLDVSLPWLTYTPSPHLEDVTLLPGEQSLGYLAYQVYRDDPAPLLLFNPLEEEHFFALTDAPLPAVDSESEIQLVGSTGIGARDQPVPAGTPAYIQSGGAVYKITVEKALRGFKALTQIKDGFGITDDPPEGKEYLMPYVSIAVARAAEEKTNFSTASFTLFSNDEQLDPPWTVLCPLPCLQPATLYPNGHVSGWIPLLAYQDDPSPLLVFDRRVYFEVAGEQDAEMTYLRQFSPDAIGYPNRDKIKSFRELTQAGPVNAIAFSVDDVYVVTAGDDKTLHVWEVETGTEMQTLKEHRGSIKHISFSADGSRLASVSNIGELIIWDTTSWAPIWKLDLKGNGLGARFLPDGTLISANTSGVLQVWDVATGQPTRQEFVPRNMAPACSGANVFSFDASDDGSILAAALSCGFGAIWELGSTKILYAVSNHQDELKLTGRPLSTTSKIVLSPDGKMAAYGSAYEPDFWREFSVLDILDVENQSLVAGVNPIDLNVIAAKIAPHKDLMLAGVGSQVIVWWPEAYVWGGNNLLQLTGHKVIVTSLEFSTRGEILATGDYSGKTFLWSAK